MCVCMRAFSHTVLASGRASTLSIRRPNSNEYVVLRVATHEAPLSGLLTSRPRAVHQRIYIWQSDLRFSRGNGGGSLDRRARTRLNTCWSRRGGDSRVVSGAPSPLRPAASSSDSNADGDAWTYARAPSRCRPATGSSSWPSSPAMASSRRRTAPAAPYRPSPRSLGCCGGLCRRGGCT